MKYITFTIPIPDSQNSIEDLNRFLGSHKIISVKKELLQKETSAYWAFLIEYYVDDKKMIETSLSKKPKVDYKDILSAENFAVFSQLRDLRKEMAAEEGKPVYALFTNEQLAKIVTQKVNSKNTLSKIEGIGKERVDKYGDKLLQYMKNLNG
ncbi:MAG: HRDC domain-containing protein [Candidatus Marinimicrobia bacterium]|nr:HRDC domain-containing protein [Candidatus Neomarinimicrobiota bacterium]